MGGRVVEGTGLETSKHPSLPQFASFRVCCDCRVSKAKSPALRRSPKISGANLGATNQGDQMLEVRDAFSQAEINGALAIFTAERDTVIALKQVAREIVGPRIDELDDNPLF
jgi:hypothetical protein